MKNYRVKSKGFVVGSLRYFPGRGYKFNSVLPHRSGSRKFYKTHMEAFPKWLKLSECELIEREG